MTEDDRLTDKDLIWHPGTGVISAAQLAAMHTRHHSALRPIPSGTVLGYDHLMADADRGSLLSEVSRLRHAVEELTIGKDNLEKERDGLRSALDALGRNERAAANRSLELQEENERLNLEVVQVQSGAQIAMNAGVTALQEVGRLEKKRDQLKEINDRMAEDRLRIIDERNRFKWMVEAARKALFEDAALSDNHRLTRLTSILGTGME